MADRDSAGAEAVDAVGAPAPMETLLSEATAGPIRRWLRGTAGRALAAALIKDPGNVTSHLAVATGELAKVVAGRSEIAPDGKDRRFADPAWTTNPLLHRVVQAYLVAAGTAESIVADAGLGWRDDHRMRFLTENLVEALAPSNNPLVNPSVLKASLEEGGANLVRGAGAMLRDLTTAPRIPQMVRPDALRVGRDLGLTPGKVVFRNAVLELIQYAPQTERVHTVPLLVIPPTINKFYVVDLAPGRSMVEYLVRSKIQTFVISWKNPTRADGGWGFDEYLTAILEALDAVETITRSATATTLGLCSGGILATLLMAHLAAVGRQDRIAAHALAVTVLDQRQAGTTGALLDEQRAAVATARSAQVGYLDGAQLAEIFAWLRPRDLIWNYWVNNYLLGKEPPAFDILAWNADTTRMSAGLHRDFISLGRGGGGGELTRPGAATVLGTPVDLSRITRDSYVVAGIADHLCPWQNCYSTTQLLGGDSRFVLSSNGHIAALVNPPGNPKSSYRTGVGNPPDADEWFGSAEKHPGSWWEDFATWLAARGGPMKKARARLGGNGLPPLTDAPGTYVYES